MNSSGKKKPHFHSIQISSPVSIIIVEPLRKLHDVA